MRRELDQRGPIDSLLAIGDVEQARLCTALRDFDTSDGEIRGLPPSLWTLLVTHSGWRVLGEAQCPVLAWIKYMP
jgi:hypothetical protein